MFIHFLFIFYYYVDNKAMTIGTDAAPTFWEVEIKPHQKPLSFGGNQMRRNLEIGGQANDWVSP